MFLKIAKEFDLEVDVNLDNCFEIYWGFAFHHKDWKFYKIDFEFEGKYLKGLIYGFRCKKLSKDFDAYLRKLNYRHSKAWPFYQYMDKYRDWNKNFFTNLYSFEDDIINVFKEKINEVIIIAKDSGFEL